jgi:hypothetical protein
MSWTPEKKRAYYAMRRNQLKRCSKCLELKTSDNYRHWSNICKSCVNTAAREYRKQKSEHFKEKWHMYYKNKTLKRIKPLPITRLWQECNYDKIEFTQKYKDYIKARTSS